MGYLILRFVSYAETRCRNRISARPNGDPDGGERGIRTLEGLLTLTPLAGVRLRPLGHLSVDKLDAQSVSYSMTPPPEMAAVFVIILNQAEEGKKRGGCTARESSKCCELGGRCRIGGVAARSFLFALDALVDFFTMHSNCLGGVDSDAHLIALYSQYCNGDVVADHHRLPHTSGQNQHVIPFIRAPKEERIYFFFVLETIYYFLAIQLCVTIPFEVKFGAQVLNQPGADKLRNLRQRRLKSCGIVAAGLGKVGTTAATTAHRACQGGHKFASRYA
jgi:hypothetical protein